MYDNYIAKIKEASLTYAAVDELAKTDSTVSDQVAFENAMKLLTFRNKEIDVWKQYFGKVGVAHNGIIALQFLQTEALIDIMESSDIYECVPNRNFYFHFNVPDSTPSEKDKYVAMTKALCLQPGETKNFFAIYANYEKECSDTLGENYNLFDMFVDNPSDYTPAMAKTLGTNLLIVMKREIRLKEKYFTEMNKIIGPSLAARFLAWEDYYSTLSKMQVWAESP